MGKPTFVSNRLAGLPVELNGPQGQAWARGMGAVQDQQMELLRVAAKARLPFLCPDDALDACGAWLLIWRFPGEPNGTPPSRPGATDGTGYRGRLCVGWSTWLKAGSKGAIIDSLHGYGLPDVNVDNDYEVSPSWVTGTWFSKFRVRIGPNLGAFGWGPGNDPTPDQQTQIKKQVLFWKWAFAIPVDVWIQDGNGYTFVISICGIFDDAFIIGSSPMGGFAP